MQPAEADHILRGFLEAKLGSSLDYFAVEGRMSPDANGDMGVTGRYRKHTVDKNVFFTVTVNLDSGKVQNLQEYI